MQKVGLVAIVAIFGISMIGAAHSTGSNYDNNNDWFNKNWGFNDWFKKYWEDFDFKKIWAYMNNGGSNDDHHDDHHDDTQSVIDSASLSVDVGIRKIKYNGQDVFQNVANECDFHSPESFAPLCVKCKFLDGDTVVATGEKIDLSPGSSYVGSTHITIPMTSYPPVKDGEFAHNDISNVENVRVEICGFKDKCDDHDTCKCDERKADHSKHYYDFDKYYKDNKNKFGKSEYSKFMKDYETYFDENGKYMDKYDFKMFMDYHGKFLSDNKKYFSTTDYNTYSGQHSKYTKDYPKHGERCDCHGEKEDHKKHYDDFDKYYKSNKNKFGKTDYSKFMDDYENYFDEEGKYMDSSDYKMYTDYHDKFLKDNKKYFSDYDYKHHSDEHDKYSKDYPKHQDEDNKCKEKTGFFTGGGKVKFGTTYVTHGFELHCDATLSPNNLEVNWLQNKFHLEELEKAICTDEPGYDSQPPPSPHPGPTLDTYTGEGYGRYNGQCGAYAIWTMNDKGEPGKNDQIVSLKIYDKKVGNTLGNLVLDINSPLNLQSGNHQFVPHPSVHPNPPTQTNPCPQMTP